MNWVWGLKHEGAKKGKDEKQKKQRPWLPF
jgi:hypothetical protein